jgi:hypothetical protein
MPNGTPYVYITGWLCIALQVLLVYRAFIGKTVRVYPIFFTYTAYLLAAHVIGLTVTWGTKGAYSAYYWTTEAVTTVLGVGVTWEIHRRVLARYPGVRRLACMLLIVIFGIVVIISTAGHDEGVVSTLTSRLVVAERDLRTVQAIVLLILFSLVAYYGIPLGRNVRGVAIGYGFGIATAVLNLSLAHYFGTAFYPIWRYGRPLEYLAALGIWCVALWAYQPDPTPLKAEIEEDYEWVSEQAVHAMVRLRTHLIHPDRS